MEPAAKFLRLLDPNAERAPEKFAELRLKLVKFFEWRRCPDPENLAHDTILRALQAVESGKELTRDDNTAFFFAVAKNVVHESRRSAASRPTVPVDEGIAQTSGDQQAYDTRILYQQLEARHLAVLEPNERVLLTRYHLEDHEMLAKELSLSPGTLRVRAHRLRQRVLHAMTLDARRPEPVKRFRPAET